MAGFVCASGLFVAFKGRREGGRGGRKILVI